MTDPIVAITATEIVRLAFGQFVKTTTRETAKSLTGNALAKAGDLRNKIIGWFKNRRNQKAENAIALIQQSGDPRSLDKLSTYLDDEMEDFPDFAREVRSLARQISHLSASKQFGEMKQENREGSTGYQFQGETINVGGIHNIGHQSIGHQGDIYQNVPVSADELLTKGVQLLNQGGYQQAISVLREAVQSDSSLAVAHYQLAVALLQGKRPKVLTRKTVEAVDESISSALALDSQNGVFHLFRALVRHDYYEVNRMRSPAPSAIEIMQSIGQYSVNQSALNQLLNQLSAMRNNPLYSSLRSSR